MFAVYNGTKQSAATFSKEVDSHGSNTRSAKCVDSAGNESSVSSHTFYVMKYANKSGTYCGSYTDTCTREVCQGGNVPDCISGIYKNATECTRIEGSSWWWETSGKKCCHNIWDDCASKVDESYSCTKYYSCWY